MSLLKDYRFKTIAFLVLLSFFFLCFYHIYLSQSFLTFSDAAKFADIARSINKEDGFVSNFRFFISELRFPPVAPFSVAIFFKLFGASDPFVRATSGFFFILLIIFLFLLGERLFGNLTGFLGAVTVATSASLLEYAISGSSESIFTLEIILGTYLFTLKKKWSDVVAFIVLVLLYFTRPQGFIYIAGLILYWLLLHFKPQKALKYFIGVIVLGVIVDFLILTPLSGKYFLYPIIGRGTNAISQVAVGSSPSDMLRGAEITGTSILTLGKKAFYNLYNFYKLLPQIMSPYLAAFFVLSLFVKEKRKEVWALKIAVFFMVVLTFLVTALTIPFFRYLHPVVPLIYFFAVATLVWIIEKMARDLRFKIYGLSLNVSRQKFITLTSLFLILVFAVGQTVGVIFLDSRFERKTKNIGKPPVYVQLSWILRNNTSPEDVVVTNLDTWGSWYGERKTVWYPLEPSMLNPPDDNNNPFDAIYLTSYLMDDPNYYMGENWRQIFSDPQNPEDKFIKENYKYAGEFEVPASETYENQSAKAVLFEKKQPLK
jgi:4-amino-4-deoxy-L-arabinose transferase-like glycosyltransferase